MKLYTEEQILEFLEDRIIFDSDDLEDLTPIELPSDEEILDEAYAQRAMVFSFTDGAKWMRNKIQGQ